MGIKDELAARKQLIDEFLADYIKKQEMPQLLKEAISYSLLAGGKRLRPILVMEGSALVGGEPDRVLPVGAALEMIHTYSLIHDDLPCMDDDDLRRGKLTNHKVYGEAVATLAGDGLLTLAFELLADYQHPDAGVKVRIIKEISRAAGPGGMVGGQVIDITSEGVQLELEDLKRMHCLKTGALFKAALRTGALAAGARGEELARVTGFAEAFGLLFQVTDDLLDVEGDSRKLGKAVGRDQKLDKATYPGILGLDRAKEMADDILAEALEALKPFGAKAEFLKSLTRFVRYREV